jgi:hypothetical protein
MKKLKDLIIKYKVEIYKQLIYISISAIFVLLTFTFQSFKKYSYTPIENKKNIEILFDDVNNIDSILKNKVDKSELEYHKAMNDEMFKQVDKKLDIVIMMLKK